MAEHEPIAVDLHCDPSCGWSQMAAAWLTTVAEVRPLRARLLPLSLAIRDGGGQPARRAASLRVCRVLHRLGMERPDAVPAFWAAVVAADRGHHFGDLRDALRLAGADVATASAADDPAVDDALREAVTRLEPLVGSRPLVPTLVLDGAVAFTGPLLRSAPDPDAAAELWDATLTLARTPGFYELSRPRPAHPALPALPPTAVPPALRRPAAAARP